MTQNTINKYTKIMSNYVFKPQKNNQSFILSVLNPFLNKDTNPFYLEYSEYEKVNGDGYDFLADIYEDLLGYEPDDELNPYDMLVAIVNKTIKIIDDSWKIYNEELAEEETKWTDLIKDKVMDFFFSVNDPSDLDTIDSIYKDKIKKLYQWHLAKTIEYTDWIDFALDLKRANFDDLPTFLKNEINELDFDYYTYSDTYSFFGRVLYDYGSLVRRFWRNYFKYFASNIEDNYWYASSVVAGMDLAINDIELSNLKKLLDDLRPELNEFMTKTTLIEKDNNLVVVDLNTIKKED